MLLSRRLLVVSALLALAPPLAAAPSAAPSREQLKSAVDVGLANLRFREAADGSWGGSVLDTALMVRAFQECPRHYTEEDGPFVRDALAYLARAMGADGSVGAGTEPRLLETAATVLALSGSTRAEYRALADRGRAFLAKELTGGPASGAGRLAALPFLLEALAADPARPAAIDVLRAVDMPVYGPELAASPRCGAGGTGRLALDLLILRFAGEPEAKEVLARVVALGGTCLDAEGASLGPSLAAAQVIATALVDPAVVMRLGAERTAAWKASLARQVLARQRLAGDWSAEGACEWSCSEVAGSALGTLALSTLQK